MGVMKAGKANARHTGRAYSLRLNGTAYGQVIPLIYGQTRATPKLIYANDFNSVQVGTGKKSGKAGGGDLFTYSIAADFLIGYRPMRGVLTAWSNKSIFILNYCDQTFVCPSDGRITPGPTPNPVFVGFPTGVPGEVDTIPGTPYTVVVANAASFLSNSQVLYHDTQVKLTQVPVAPIQGEYMVDVATGTYTFSAADSGRAVEISYSYNGGGSGPPIVYILGATAELPIDVTFNDFGAPGPRTVQGSSAMPLWDARYALPVSDGDTDPTWPSTLPSNRAPYIFNVNSLTGEIIINAGAPGPLTGLNITIYYAYQAPDPSTGFGTPLANLGLAWEPILGSSSPGGGNPITVASEYLNHPDQWVPFTSLTGAGGPDFSLGESDTLPNLSFEVVGLMQLGHAHQSSGNRFIGGCSPADVLQDLVSSGPPVIFSGTPA